MSFLGSKNGQKYGFWRSEKGRFYYEMVFRGFEILGAAGQNDLKSLKKRSKK
jgi:hypothetical protein